jgi:tripeptide aminopeptidase
MVAANVVPTGISVGDVSQLRGVRDVLQWFTREKQWINEIHLQLCRIPAATFLEQQRAEWMVAQFRAMGCDAQVDRAGNVVATLVAGGRGPYVAVTAHLDTVWSIPMANFTAPEFRTMAPA